MIYALMTGGRMGNQLMVAANMMASSLEYGIPYKNLSFKAETWFDSLETEKHGIVNKYKPEIELVVFYVKVMRRLFGKAPGVRAIYDNGKAVEYFKRSNNKKTQLFDGWPYMDYYALYHQQDRIRRMIVPKKQYIEQAGRWLSSILEPGADKCPIGGVGTRGDKEHHIYGGNNMPHSICRVNGGGTNRSPY